MRTFYILFFTLSLVLSCCGLKSDSDSEHRKDTVINFDSRAIYWPGTIYHVPTVEMLDKDLYAQIVRGNGYDNVYIYDTFRDTVVDLEHYYIAFRKQDGYNADAKFVEDFINTYYNHYPLTDKGYKNIRKIIVCTLLYYTPWSNRRNYKDIKNNNRQPISIVDSCFVNDTLNKIYKVSICDTIDNRTAKVELRYQNNHYKFFYEMYYKGRRY